MDTAVTSRAAHKRPLGRLLEAAEVRSAYLRLGDIKRVAAHFHVRDRYVRLIVRDLIAENRARVYRETTWRLRGTTKKDHFPNVAAGVAWACAECGARAVVPDDEQAVCRNGHRAPWLRAANPFTAAERGGIPIDTSSAYGVTHAS